MSRNSYTITRPIDNGKKSKYTKLLDFLKSHRNEEFSRIDLFIQSGYWNDEILQRFENNTAFRGQNCYVTSKMNELGILKYNPRTKKWGCGENIDNVKY